MRSRGRRLGLIAVIALVGAGLAVPMGGSAGDSTDDAVELTNEALKALDEAKKKADGPTNEFELELVEAARVKHLSIEAVFKGKPLIGDCDAAEVIQRLDDIDVLLERAALAGEGKVRTGRLEAALNVAKALDKQIDACAQGVAAGGGDLIKAEVREIAKQDKAKLSDKELRERQDRVLKYKKQLLAGETIDGCVVTEFFLLVEKADLLITGARETTPDDFGENGKRKATKERREIIEKAKEAVLQLAKSYLKLPCGGVSDEPPPPAGDEPPPDGTPPPPPAQECSNDLDDDGDGTADVDGSPLGLVPDEACLSTADTTEAHTDWPIGLPGDGGSNTNFIDFKPNFSDTPPNVVGWEINYNPTLHTSSDANQGAAPINGTGLCDHPSGTSIEISSGVGASAPTVSPNGTPLPPAPDANHMRIVIDIDDDAGGSACSGTVPLRVATDTR